MRFWIIYFVLLVVIGVGYNTGIPVAVCAFAAGFVTALGALKLFRVCEPGEF